MTQATGNSYLVLPGRTQCVPGEQLTEGGEAALYAVGDRKVAKVHFPATLANGQRPVRQLKVARLVAMRTEQARNRALANVVWPEQSLFNDKSHFVGYLMPRLVGVPLHAVFHDVAWTLADRVDLAAQMATSYAALHAIGIAVGDPSSNNVLATRDRRSRQAWLVDTDSFHLPSFPCLVATERYRLPPVLQGKQPWAAGPEADNHALAFLLFELQLGGLSPYQHKGGGSPEQCITKEFCPLLQQKETELPEGPWLARWQALPHLVRDLFTRAFVPGRTRPTAKDWATVLALTVFPTSWPDLQAPAAVAAAAPTKRRFLDMFLRRKTA